MARVCESCGKKTIFGRNVSHAHNVTPRRFEPNLQRVRIREASGATRKAVLCTRCIRTGGFRKRVS